MNQTFKEWRNILKEGTENERRKVMNEFGVFLE